MENVNLNSDGIKTISYDDVTRQLYVRFQNGEYYVYYEVFPLDYIGFLSTSEHRKFLEDRLDFKYDKKKLH